MDFILLQINLNHPHFKQSSCETVILNFTEPVWLSLACSLARWGAGRWCCQLSFLSRDPKELTFSDSANTFNLWTALATAGKKSSQVLFSDRARQLSSTGSLSSHTVHMTKHPMSITNSKKVRGLRGKSKVLDLLLHHRIQICSLQHTETRIFAIYEP